MKIVGLMVVGPGEADRYLKKPLDCLKRFCDDAVICLNGEDKKRDKLIQEYGFWSYRDDREWGIYQPYIKTDLLRKIGGLKPDWILPLDSDEEFDSTITREILETLSVEKRGCYFYIVNHWGDESHYHRGLSFWNIRYFKFLSGLGLQYLKKPLHCGLGPPYAYFYGTYVPHLVRHYGLMKKEDREKKVERYNQYDPRMEHKSPIYYETIAEDVKPATFNEEAVLNKIRDDVSKMFHQKKYND